MMTFAVGDRAIYTNPFTCTETICIVEGFRDPVRVGGGVFKGEEDTPVKISIGPQRIKSVVTLSSLAPYKTPKYPPGVTPINDYEKFTIKEVGEIEVAIEDMNISEKEKDILKEMNENDTLSILAGEGRDVALLGIDQKDMDDFEEKCNMCEEYHRLIAKSPQGGRVEDYSVSGYEGTNGEEVIVLRNRNKTSEGAEELDYMDRVMVEATMKHVGQKYMTATTKYGALYIDLKFTKYIPRIGEKFNCIMGVKGPTSNLPWKCFRVIV